MSEAFVRCHNSSSKPNESRSFYEELLGWAPSEGLREAVLFVGVRARSA